MRLTLRTLLAWLDDTLPPAEVRQIGQQVAETPIAGDLVERIHRVTRQRRLTVPNGTGADGVDPNIVAGYLGDELPAEIVGEYEKRCLTSDVHLAEVASVHQILSLLGQKAKVPPEAKQRMYHLIRGREATAAPQAERTEPRPRKSEPRAASAWTPEPAPRRSAVERFGPPAAVAALIAILCWSAYVSVGPAVPSKPPATAIARAPVQPKAAPNAENRADAKIEAEPDKPAPKPDDMPVAKPAVEPADKPETPAPSEPEAAPLPAGAVGVVGKGEFLLLRFNPTDRTWALLGEGAMLRDGDRIVNLAPSLAEVRIGSAPLTLVGDTEVKVLTTAASSSRFELTRGRVRIASGTEKESVTVTCDSSAVMLAIPPSSVVGLERVNRRVPGMTTPAPPVLHVIASEGTTTVEAGGSSATLEPGSALKFQTPNTLGASAPLDPLPEWLTTMSASPAAQERLKALAKYIKPDRAPLIGLIEAIDDESPAVRADAITTVGAIGPLDMIVSTMSAKGNPPSRKAAIAVLRDVARRDASSAKALREALEKVGDSKEWATEVESMLVGFSNKDIEGDMLGESLVNLLKHEDVGMRELAIETLLAISKRGDALGYDPDRPSEGNGIKAWADLVERRELQAPSTDKP